MKQPSVSPMGGFRPLFWESPPVLPARVCSYLLQAIRGLFASEDGYGRGICSMVIPSTPGAPLLARTRFFLIMQHR